MALWAAMRRLLRSRAQPPPPPPSVDVRIQADTVDALVESVRALLRDEDAREQSFTARGVGLSGFAGLIISLAGAVSAALVGPVTGSHASPPLAAPWKWIVVGLIIGSLLLLLATVAVVVLGVLLPREFASFSMAEVERYPRPEFVHQPRVMVQGRTLRGLVTALASERKKNARKAYRLRRAYQLLLEGLAGVTVLAIILGLHAVQLI